MPTIRGTGIQQAVSNSYTVNWPAGTAAGDQAIIFGQQTATFTVPTGWTQISTSGFNTAGTARGVIIYKTLTAADITAGNVVLANAGSNSGTVVIITYIGAFDLSCQDFQAAGTTSFTPTCATPYGATADVLYFGSNIANSANTVNLGASQQTNSAASSSAALYAGALTGSGTVLPTFSFPTAGTGYYAAIVMVFSGGDGSYGGGNDLPALATGTNEAQSAGWPVVGGPPTALAPVWPDFTFPKAVVGVLYSEQWDLRPAAAPTTYTLFSGTLPTGLSLTSPSGDLGVISGTPTAAGSYTFALTATNVYGFANKSFTIIVVAASGAGNVAY